MRADFEAWFMMEIGEQLRRRRYLRKILRERFWMDNDRRREPKDPSINDVYRSFRALEPPLSTLRDKLNCTLRFD